MKLYNRILSTFLAVILMLGSFASFMVMNVSAADATLSSADDIHGHYVINKKYKTPEEKLESMTLRLTRGDYELYVDGISGEVAMKNVKTGDILFSNPYDVASDTASSEKETGTKNEILSQILIKYSGGGTSATLNSFKDAAMRGQIVVQNVKNGVRVEYTIGQDESRKLVPRQIEKSRYENLILAPLSEAVQSQKIEQFECTKFDKMYALKSINGLSEIGQEQILKDYPVCAKMDIYVLKDASSVANMDWMEGLIKEHCEGYSFEEMDKDHDETGFVAQDEKYPLFRLALEYNMDDSGLLVSLPCNGLRYDMTSYTLENISVLPYMGAGNHTNEGYNFFPDGSGSLFNFKQLNAHETSYISGKIYGVDYAYHTITGTYERVIRYPVYGTVAQEIIYSLSFIPKYELDENYDIVLDAAKQPKPAVSPKAVEFDVSNTVMSKADIRTFVAERQGIDPKNDDPAYTLTEKSYKRGYVAVIEAGESMAELETYQGGSTHGYNTLRNYFNPKPKDTYTLKDSLSVTGTTSFPVVSDRKYTGDIKIRYQILTDPEKTITVGEQTTTVAASGMKYYETTWLGMAEAYRDNMVASGKLSKLTSAELENDIPLYLEVFGTLETQQTIATIPVDVMTPLTTFENVYDMYAELSEQSISNINFKLTGFANGGMYATVPAKLKWEKAVGGKKGFRELLKKAEEVNATEGKNLGIYPDFDFAYVHKDTTFDSTNLKKDALKTIDGRYSSKRQYSATQQSYVTFYQLAMSPSRYSKFYEKLLKNLEDYDLKSMSIASLGNSLNSDFDEDDPYNREDGKDFTVQAFQDLQAAGYSLMTESANAYTWGYVDHILNVDLDSSRYVRSSASVPFIGAVLHGYVQFAGAPFNEEGDTDYAILRAIENGAGLYFILSYQNTHELKVDEQLSQYYSIRYDIWKEDVIRYYNTLNAYLKDVQDKEIIAHSFLQGDRVLDADELENGLDQALKDAAQAEQEKQNAVETQNTLYLANQWKTIATAPTVMKELLQSLEKVDGDIEADYNAIVELIESKIPGTVADIETFLANGALIREVNGEQVEVTLEDLLAELNAYLTNVKLTTVEILKNCYKAEAIYEQAQTLTEDVASAIAFIESKPASLPETAYNVMIAQMGGYKTATEAFFAEMGVMLNAIRAYHDVNVVPEEGEPYNSNLLTFALSATESLKLDTDDSILKKVRDSKYGSEDKIQNACAQIEDFLVDFKDRSMAESAKPSVGGASGETEETELVFDNNKIVLVTYGTRENSVKTPYKSFILNYNIYAVTVSLNGVVYTIPSGGCVMIQH